MKEIILATRGSKLALVQANIVKHSLEELGCMVTIKTVTTKGDRNRKDPLSKVGGNGLFIREIEQELLSGTADIAVHSGKDLPYELAPGLEIAATPKAADSRDVIVSRVTHRSDDTFIIGTSSARRVDECQKLFPNATFQNIRGNVDTRLHKLRNGEYDAVIFAKAGLDRLGANLKELNVAVMEPEEMIPAPCQGIVAVECRSEDEGVKSLLKLISDPATERRFIVERYLFSLLQVDCSTGIGIYSEPDGDNLSLSVLLGEKKIRQTGTCKEYQALCQAIKEALDE